MQPPFAEIARRWRRQSWQMWLAGIVFILGALLADDDFLREWSAAVSILLFVSGMWCRRNARRLGKLDTEQRKTE